MGDKTVAKLLLDEIGEYFHKCLKSKQEADLDLVESRWAEVNDEKYRIRDGYTYIGRMITEYVKRKDEANMERWMAEDDKHELTKKADLAIRHFSKGEDYLDLGNEEKAFHYFSLAEKEKPGIAFTKGSKYSNFYMSKLPHLSWTADNDKEFRKQVADWKKNEIYLLPIKEIEKVPESERTPDLIILLAECYDDYAYFECELEPKKEKQALKKALKLLMSVEHLPKNEASWYRGMSDTYLLIDDAEKCLHFTEKWLELEPDDKFIAKRVNDLKKSIEKDRIKEEKKDQKALERRSAKGSSKNPFGNFKFTRFWNDDKYALENWIGRCPADSEIWQIEKELGYKLPESYVWLMKKHNGGVPRLSYFIVDDMDAIADGFIKISGIYGIGREKEYSLCGKFGNDFLIKEWNYPEIGVVLCGGDSGGHDMVYLDYRECGRDGEPSVVHIDQENGYTVTPLADNFVEFIKGLVDEEETENPE